jgi:hypothetical protein
VFLAHLDLHVSRATNKQTNGQTNKKKDIGRKNYKRCRKEQTDAQRKCLNNADKLNILYREKLNKQSRNAEEKIEV